MKALFASNKPLIASSPEKADVVIAVDVSNQAFRCAFAYQNLAVGGKPSGHIFGTAVIVLTTLKDFVESKRLSAYLTFFIDHPSKRKYAIHSEYKAGRTSREELGFNPVAEALSLVSLFPGRRYWCLDEEADDVLASFVANRAKHGFKSTTPVIVLSSDKDLWQLREPSVSFVGNKGAVPGKEAFEEAYGKYAYDRPTLIPLIKAIFGDSSDNIPKVPRLQWKQVEPVFGMCDPTPESFYEKLEDSKVDEFMTMATYEKIIEHKDMVFRNFKLTQLKKDLELTHVDNTTSKEVLGSFLDGYECRTLIQRIPALFTGA